MASNRTVETHIHYTVDSEGRPQRAYHSISEARAAVESDDYWHSNEVDYVPDVPLIEAGSDSKLPGGGA
ncbi:uncharacterized protein NP_7064A (plasmid) [Natronomonas pharaonis DSM 2160]|uniref:Uncharacterized protein n=1 Tax=Natronomonas pharaonis (strain ATCC 35678 / DSM 2160 / CIP 103997 / JCM 8858 / NBRC 14720 / NCIMB 2260 / Gabara) TaxID=348780 RepID=Q3ILS3_NATPD|nr:hypothetical protein [Natronomonas pharaonis]CAI49711.1 uncharacterized protein NP_3240A [Natronomonas pharaonis DSM 2160]CAI50948.1 uncharacterized protein NP_7064A [Natronomonas pharaonis DSM 2160]